MATKRVLSVGQCMADHGSISWTLKRNFSVEIIPAHSAGEALDQLRQGNIDLVLVNRIFDADGTSGLELIRQIKQDETARNTPVMLVSNYADAQEQAEAAGAVPGFGKGELGQPEMLERVGQYLK